MFAPIRCEADLYGYSCWLSYHLKLDTTPVSRRGFGHGWLWWDPTDLLPTVRFGLDVNTNTYWGLLTQDSSFTKALTNSGVCAVEGGLPFLNYYYNSGLLGRFKENRSGKILYVPTHSNPWYDCSTDVIQSVIEFSCQNNPNFTVMLGGSDRHLQDVLTKLGIRCVLGAQVNDVLSFIRLQENFESHEFLITDEIGSHVCYGLHCGMKVGIQQDLFEKNRSRPQQKSHHGKTLESITDPEAFERIWSLTYLKSRFPGLVYSNGLPTYDSPPPIAQVKPEIVASLLGWDYPDQSQQVKNTRGEILSEILSEI